MVTPSEPEQFESSAEGYNDRRTPRFICKMGEISEIQSYLVTDLRAWIKGSPFASNNMCKTLQKKCLSSFKRKTGTHFLFIFCLGIASESFFFASV